MTVDDRRDGVPSPGEQLTIVMQVQNLGTVAARDARATLQAGNKDVVVFDDGYSALGGISADGQKTATFSIIVRDGYRGPDRLPLRVRLEESRPEATRIVTIPIRLGAKAQGTGSARPADEALSQEIPASLPDVDEDLPRARMVDQDAIGLVIGIEKYNSQIPGVPFAQRDAASMRDRFVRILGVPAHRLIYLTNERATKGAIQTALDGKLPAWSRTGRSRVFVYFAGHGAPDPDTKAAFLVPYDGDPDYAKASCYPLDAVYKSLGSLGARSVTVMLDTCFSGVSGRGDSSVSLMAQARPLFVAPVPSSLPPGISVLAAAKGDQVSSGFPAASHGLFTYYLLRGLQGDAGKFGRLTVGDLGAYLAREIPAQARLMGRSQNPVLMGGRGDDILVER